MVAAITSDEFLAEVRAAAMVPAADGRLTDPEIFRIADRLLRRAVGRAVYDADDGRWIKTAADVAVTSGTATYRIPDRAWGSGVDQVSLVQTSTGDVTPLAYVDRSEVHFWDASGVWREPRWTMEGDVIRLLPEPTDSSYSLRVRYVRRPSKLVTVAECAAVTSLTASAITATLPAAWTSTMDIDVVEASNNVEALEDDIAVTASGGTTLTRSSGSYTTTGAYGVAAGDYACTAGETCVVQVPDVALGLLVELTARDVCVAFGDQQGAQARQNLAMLAQRDVEQSIAERSRTRVRVINRNSPLRTWGMGRTRLWGRR